MTQKIKDPIFSKKRILVADDDESIQDYVNAILKNNGFSTLLAANGEEALNLAKSENPDLILIDAEMPIMTGFEAISKIRAHPKCRMIPIILLTALKKTEDRIKGIEAGCDNFMSKPFDTHELLAQIKTLLTLSYYRTLLDEREKLDYLINHMNSGIIVLDPMMQIIQINQKAQEYFQIDLSLGDNFDFDSHIYSQYKVEYEGDLVSDIKSKTVSFGLERPETNNFRHLFLSVRSSSIKNPTGELNSVVMIILDSTDQRKNDFLKLTFADFISHKLLTPLTSMEAGLALFQDKNGNDEIVDICLREYNVLKNRILTILTFCKSLGNDSSLSVERIMLSDYLLRLSSTLVQTKGDLKIDYEMVCPDKKLCLYVERKNIDLILNNLIDNAIEYNDQKDVKIRVEAKPLGPDVEILVSDNGRGIPPEDIERVFENFYQIDKWSTGNLKGVGLGLSIVKHLVERHGGSIQIDSKLTKGTTFILTMKNASHS